MKIELDIADKNANKIQSYSEDSFKVKNNIYASNIVISRDTLIDNWSSEGFKSFATQHLDQIIQWQPEIIILGTGETIASPDPEMTAYVNAHQIGFEIMHTGAACRSYNVLIDEGRHVVACLFLSPD